MQLLQRFHAEICAKCTQTVKKAAARLVRRKLQTSLQKHIAGIQSLDGLSFTANYTLADFQTLKALEGKKVSYAVWFGGTESDGTVTPDGSNGKFSFDGELSVYPVGGGVNEVVNMNITIAPSTPIAFSAT